MSKEKPLFEDVPSVSEGYYSALKMIGCLNSDGTVVSWKRLAPAIRDRKFNQRGAKCLILIELSQRYPRDEILYRLVNYLSHLERRQTMARIKSLLKE